MKDKIILALKVIAFFGVGFVILYLVFANQQEAYYNECALKGISKENCSLLDKVLSDFSDANFWILGLSIIMFMLSNVIRALRWHLLLQPLGYKPRLVNSLGATMIGYLLNLSIPRAGEIAKPATLSRNENIPLDITIGTIVTDRIMDVICLGIVFLLTIILAYDKIIDYLEENLSISEKFKFLSESPIHLTSITLLGAAVTYLIYKKWDEISQISLVGKIKDFVLGVWKGALSVTKMKNKGLFILYSILIWVLYYLMTYVVFFAITPTSHLSAVTGLVVFLFGSLGIVIPSPGGMGSYHFLVGEALMLHGIDGTDAFSFANIAFFTIQLGNIVFGGLALVFLPFFNKKK